MDTVIIWHICDILWKFQPSSSIFRLWHLEAKILKWPENGQNPKGGPLDEKNIFSTTFLDLVENRLKWLEMLCWFQKHVDQYIFDIWCHQMTSAVIRCHVMSYDDIQCHKVHWYICFWNQHRVSDRLSLFTFRQNETTNFLAHVVAGMLLVFFCNSFVIIGILRHASFLLIPWLLCYGMGKKSMHHNGCLWIVFY